MSLEAAIAENTAVLSELIRILQTPPHVDNFPVQPAAEQQEIPAQLREAKPTPKPAAVPSSEPTPTASGNSENSSTGLNAAEVPAVTLDDAKKAVVMLFKSRENPGQARQLTAHALSRFGAVKVIDLLPEHYGPFVALVNEVLAGERV